MPKPRRETPWFERWRGDIFYAFWYDAEARQRRSHSLGTKKPSEASARFAAFLIEGVHLHSGGKAREANGLTTATALDDYQREHAEVKAADPRRIELCVAQLKEFFGGMLITDLDISACRAYAEARRSGVQENRRGKGKGYGAKDGTIRRELSVLSAALNHAVRWKRLARNDLPTLELPRPKATRGTWLFPDELARLRAAAHGACADFIDLAYYTAARRSSLEGLTVFQVNLEGGRIRLSPEGDVQTNKRRPIIPIDPAVRPTVTRLVEQAKSAGTEYLFGPNADFYHAFKWTAKRAGLYNLPARDMRSADRISPHVLRHTRATHLLQAGRPPWAVANLLGDSVTTVLRTYGHACPEYMAEILGTESEL